MKRTGIILSLLLAMGMLLSIAATSNAYVASRGLTGLLVNKPEAFQGYTLFTPSMSAKEVYLLDMQGRVVHTWHLPDQIFYAEMLPNGNIIAAVLAPGAKKLRGKDRTFFGGEYGHIVEMDWDGKIVWEVTMDSPKLLLHHGFDRMPNGNTMVLGWEQKSWDEAKAKGRRADLIPDGPVCPAAIEGFWPDVILELDKQGKVVWQWHAWDNIGIGKDKFDINFSLNQKAFTDRYHYPDWTHFNSVRYNPETDQLLVSSRSFGEMYIIDKKTGKIVWRWGNPGVYGAGKLPGGYGDDGDQKLFGNHDANWLPNGNLSIFDNGTYRPSSAYSRAVEMNPKTGEVVWEYKPPNPMMPQNFYTSFQGAAQKLPNGNYLITSTNVGQIFEVTPDKKIVWEYINPVFTDGIRGVDVSAPGSLNWVHRAFRYAADHPAFKGKTLVPNGDLKDLPDAVKIMAPYVK